MRNNTLNCSPKEIKTLLREVHHLSAKSSVKQVDGKVICGDIFIIAESLPCSFVDLLILDPPYNLSKNYNGTLFKAKEEHNYRQWFEDAIHKLKPTLKPTATIYICSDWKTSILIAPILESYFYIRNRISWEREKGRGAKYNWKNNTEDIWFCTVSDQYHFDVESVKLKRKVIAPYKTNAKPKDWMREANGNYRLTHPSNIWTDITIPFWSMAENTAHPTQKPEKLIAKLILASSKSGDFVLDPFAGSGTTAVVAKKLKRHFCAIELNEEYCCWGIKRLQQAAADPTIQGYRDNIFWERNSQPTESKADTQQEDLFP